MIKTSKIRFILLICLLVSLLSGCFLTDMFKVEIVTYENSITLTLDNKVKPYVINDSYPSFTWEFEGKVNCGKNRTGEFEIVLYKNDDIFVSRLVEKLLKKYEEENRVFYRLINTETTAETWMNRIKNDESKKEYIKVKDNKIYNEFAYIELENGLLLSLNYARFDDFDGNTYYRWQKTESIRLILHYPLRVMKNKENLENCFVIMPIPAGTIISFDTTTKRIDSLLKDDKFINDEYYTYTYPTSYEEDYNRIVDYYTKVLLGKWIDNIIEVNYLGFVYQIYFTNENFRIDLINN